MEKPLKAFTPRPLPVVSYEGPGSALSTQPPGGHNPSRSIGGFVKSRPSVWETPPAPCGQTQEAEPPAGFWEGPCVKGHLSHGALDPWRAQTRPCHASDGHFRRSSSSLPNFRLGRLLLMAGHLEKAGKSGHCTAPNSGQLVPSLPTTWCMTSPSNYLVLTQQLSASHGGNN